MQRVVELEESNALVCEPIGRWKEGVRIEK